VAEVVQMRRETGYFSHRVDLSQGL
jgi:hypothetical protein